MPVYACNDIHETLRILSRWENSPAEMNSEDNEPNHRGSYEIGGDDWEEQGEHCDSD